MEESFEGKPMKKRSIEDTANNLDADCWMLRRKKSDAARDLVDLSERAMMENCYKASRAYRFASLYEGFNLTNISAWGADVTNSTNIFPGLEAPVIKNRCRALCQTFVAKSFANDSPLPQFTTKGGSFDQVNGAEDLDQTICAEFAEPHGQFNDVAEMHRHGALIAAASTGQYAVFCIDYDNATRPECELDDTLTLGIYRAYRYGPLRHCVRTVWMLPEEAVRKFGNKFKEQIYANVEPRAGAFVAGKGVLPAADAMTSTAHLVLQRREVRVIMGWAVQVGQEPGRQMFCLKDGTILRDRDYEKHLPPFVKWEYDIELGGDSGTPLTQSVYMLSRYQNRILHDVDSAERKTSQVIIAVQSGTAGSQAVKSQLAQSQAVSIIEVNGPIEGAFKVMDSPKFSRDSLALEAVYDQAQFDDTRIPRSHVTSASPKNVNSGVQESLAASYYTESFADAERRSIQVRAVGTTKIMLWVLQSLAEKGFERWIGDKEFRRQVTAADLDLDDDKYILEIKPVGEGKDTPKSRLEKAERWLKDPSVPFIGADMVRMSQNYDLDRMKDQIYALDGWVEDQIKRYLKSPAPIMAQRDFYQPPERWMQLEGIRSALRIMANAFLRARQSKAPQPRLNYFEKFCNDCVTLIESEEKRIATLNQPPAPPGAGAPAAPPTAAPPLAA
jgi:hypothetical protein